ncbi:xanthine dehydrogenase family protein molybdopterin-binding subunit [Microvirga massiliensis]|uniref:xanthine dehydrogenase family protein molybdopterin-binding subunit n=1 Tax=Microvirga massiliensis TaxID=1033741 RepID=UPI00062B3188|nr:molybdopterin cofactor-binding domain-containing protein [Microvirga massiliensis]
MSKAPPPEGSDGAGLPGSLRTNPQLAQWLRFSPSGFVEVSPGKIEIGQGILTALAQIAADELDVSLERIRMVAASTARSPDEGVTSGSLSVQNCGTALRFACADARAIYLAAAAAQIGVPAEVLDIQDGTIIGPGNARTSYWELADSISLAVNATATAKPKAVSARTVAGTAAARRDIPAKVFGPAGFIHDLRLPGMLHGRVLRPQSPGARLLSLDEAAVQDIAGFVGVVRDGNFIGVIAETEEGAHTALLRLRGGALWSDGETLPDEVQLPAWLKSQPCESSIVASREAGTGATVARTLRREYSRPFLAHASIAPSCALAQWSESGVHVWSHSQGIYNLRADLSLVLSTPPDKIVVEHVEGAGCYGHNGADDVALDAVLLARATGGRPVRVQWSREDELVHAPFGAAMAIGIEADFDEGGEIVGWRHEIWGNGHVARPGRAEVPRLLAATELAKPFARVPASNPPLASGGGAERNAVPFYEFPSWRIMSHRVLAQPLRTSSLRSLGAFANVFAIESFLDELAEERGEDPVAFRLRHLRDPRARTVLEAAAARAAWASWEKRDGVGHGVGCARYKNSGAYCAVVSEVEGDAEIRVKRLVIAVDVGEVINPDGVANQIEGGAIQATSWTLKEAVRFDRNRVTSDSWENYPILRFSEVPAVEVEIVSRPDEPPLGAGEAALGPTAAAIANAVSDALGIRIRDLPMTRDRIIAAMA